MSKGIKGYLTPLYDRYQGFSLRERVLVSLSVMAVTWFVWAATLGGYLDTFQQEMDKAVAAFNQRIQSAATEQSRLQNQKASNPNALLQAERERLNAQLDHMSESLGTLLDRFVDPKKMPSLLEDVIKHHGGLTLVRMESLPAEAMDVSPPPAEGKQRSPVWIYRHPLRMEFKGAYFDVMAYLAELERGPWEFGWRRLDYEVTDYPMATITLEIETLSREKSWIGV